jgi:hypothetical protein
MKVGVFFHAYEQLHANKDPGQITLGLNDIGVRAEMVTLEKAQLGADSDVPLRLVSPSQARSPAFWESTDYDVVLAYSWLRSDFLWIPKAMKAGGKRVVVKGDTDGRINAPIHPRWDCFASQFLGVLPSLKIIRRRITRKLRAGRIWRDFSAHLACADMAVVETPQAFSNIACIAERWGASQLLQKITVIPNPVAPSALARDASAKQKRVVAIGSWKIRFGDYYAKNTPIMCCAVVRFLSARSDYEATLVGDGGDLLDRCLAEAPGDVRVRVHVTGALPHGDVLRTLGNSKIFFMPSISEGCPMAAGEALSQGCSIVGGPLESLQFFALGGTCGTLAASFSEEALAGALAADAIRWDRGEYRPDAIFSVWRERLDRKEVARCFARLFQQVIDGTG